MYEQITEKAFSLFRPVLKQLKVQELKITPNIVRASQYPDLIITGMERWIIIARQASLKDGTQGFAEIILDQKIIFIC